MFTLGFLWGVVCMYAATTYWEEWNRDVDRWLEGFNATDRSDDREEAVHHPPEWPDRPAGVSENQASRNGR